MDLRNWETFVLTGLPVVGASVEVRDAVLTHPNTGTILATTTTDGNGMWEFLGLSDTPKDTKITYLGKVKWLKGLTKHSIDLAQGSAYTPANQNLLKNGGLETWKRGSLTNYVLGANAAAPIAAGWIGRTGSGDSMTVTREASIIVTASQFAAKAVYVRSAGAGYLDQSLPTPLVYALRGRDVVFSCQVRQGVASNVKAAVNDTTETLGSAVATTGSFITLSVARTVPTNATALRIGIKILASDTVYLDNAMMTLGAGVPTFAPRAAGEDTDQQTYEMMDRVYSRYFLLGAN